MTCGIMVAAVAAFDSLSFSRSYENHRMIRMKSNTGICRHCGATLIRSPLLAEAGIPLIRVSNANWVDRHVRAVWGVMNKVCYNCGSKNGVRVDVTHAQEAQEQPEDREIKKQQRAGLVFIIAALCFGLIVPLVGLTVSTFDIHLPSAVVNTLQQHSRTLVTRLILGWGWLPAAVLFYYCAKWRGLHATRLQGQRLLRLARTEQRPPVLLLRSFLNSRLGRQPPLQIPTSEGLVEGGEGHITKTLDKFLVPFGRPVAIGIQRHEQPDSGEQQTIFVEASNETWRSAVSHIAAVSRFVLMLPGWTDGVLNEMEIIRSEQLCSRTIVYMPPIIHGSNYKELAEEWNRVRQRCVQSGFHIPVYDSRGMLYIPREDFSIYNQVFLLGALEIKDPHDLPGAIAIAILELLPMLSGKCGTIANALASLEETCCLSPAHPQAGRLRFLNWLEITRGKLVRSLLH